jgi:hypothetical protein
MRPSMDRTRTVVRRDGGEGISVDDRLRELGVMREQLMAVRDAALAAAAEATPFFPANAAGTFAYFYGTQQLREQFVGADWRIDRTDGVETVVNEKLNLKLGFQNVDLACDEENLPRPRSPKGAGAERACTGNLFGHLPHDTPKPDDSEPATFFLMVDQDGATELSRPVVGKRGYLGFVERIFLFDGGDLDDLVVTGSPDQPSDGGADEIEIKIDRK